MATYTLTLAAATLLHTLRHIHTCRIFGWPSSVQLTACVKLRQPARLPSALVVACRLYLSAHAYNAASDAHAGPLGQVVLPRLPPQNYGANYVYSVAQQRSCPYLIEPWGKTISEWLDERVRDDLAVMALVQRLADQVAQVHAHGRVHARLQPGSVLRIVQDRSVKFMDTDIQDASDAGALHS